jgi:hypothetical protein
MRFDHCICLDGGGGIYLNRTELVGADQFELGACHGRLANRTEVPGMADTD